MTVRNVSAANLIVAQDIVSGSVSVSATVLIVAQEPEVPPTAGGGSGTSSGQGTSRGGTPSAKPAARPNIISTPRFSPLSSLSNMDGTVGYVQWRAFVGPPFRKETDGDFYDWSALTLAAYTPSPSDTTLSSGVAYNDTVANLTSAASFPSAGGLWLGPNGSGEAWGYATYTGKATNQLTGLTRDTVDVEYSGVHTAAAVARFWWELDTGTATPTLREQMDGSYSSVSWELEIGGIVAPVPALRPGHLLLFQTRELSGASWGNWTNFAIGWISGHTLSDDAEQMRPWTLKAGSLHLFAGMSDASGLHVGAKDIADNSSVTASSSLSPGYKEANTGEFTESSPSLGPGQTVDNDAGTLWMSGKYIGENNPVHDPAAEALDGIRDARGITGLHISKFPGQSSGYRWIEITFFDTVDATDWLIAGIDYMVRFENTHPSLDYTAGDIVILAENPTLFNEEWPENDATAVVDLADYLLWNMNNNKWSLTTGGASAGTFTLTVDGDTTAGIAYNASAATIQAALVTLTSLGADSVRVEGSAEPWTITFINEKGSGDEPGAVSGSGAGLTGGSFALAETQAGAFPSATASDGSAIFDYLDPASGIVRLYNGPSGLGESQVVWGTTEVMGVWAPVWTGSALAAMTAGQSARMIFNPAAPSTSAEFWEIGNVATPGYNVVTADKEWILYDLPTMGLILGAAMTDISPAGGGTISIENAAGASVDGLPASGTIQIGIEQITYSAIDRDTALLTVTARGANSTVAAAHSAGDTIYFLNGAVATEAYPIDTIEMTRPTGLSTLQDFIVRGSELATARTPDEANYTNDYTTLATVTSHASATYTLDLSSSPSRIRYLLVEITAMSASPSRAKINETRVIIDPDVLNGAYNLASGSDVADAATSLLSAAGIPAAAITDAGSTQAAEEYTTESGLLWPILVDLGEFTNSRITLARDSKVTIAPDAFWGIAGTPSEAAQFTRTDISSIEQNKMPVYNVGQINLVWRTPGASAEESATFPASLGLYGRKIRVGPLMYADQSAADAGAQKRYYQMRRPYDILCQMSVQSNSVRPGTIYGLQWTLHDSQLAQDRTYLVVSAVHQIKNFGWSTVLSLLQLNRTDEL